MHAFWFEDSGDCYVPELQLDLHVYGYNITACSPVTHNTFACSLQKPNKSAIYNAVTMYPRSIRPVLNTLCLVIRYGVELHWCTCIGLVNNNRRSALATVIVCWNNQLYITADRRIRETSILCQAYSVPTRAREALYSIRWCLSPGNPGNFWANNFTGV